MRVFLLIATLFVAANADSESLPPLEGMQNLNIFCATPEELTIVKSHEGVFGFDFLKFGHDFVDVLVTADRVPAFKQLLEINNIKYEVVVENFKEKVIEEFIEQQVARRSAKNLQGYAKSGRLSFTYYPDVNEIDNYIEYIAKTHSDVATLVNIGTSFEGRQMKALKLSTGGENKPGIYIDAGIHAREWIAPATGLFILDQLLEEPANRHLLESVDWYIVPMANPDGYQFTHSSVVNRLWRKTRSINRGSSCHGVDGNRNYDIKWMTIGASSNPCSDTFAGTQPFSEPETKNVRDFILGQNGAIKMYLALHSYGQYILYPWGWTTALPDNEPELRSLAAACAKAISSVRKTTYTFGTSANHLYPSAGGSDDWAMAKGGADFAYTYELPGKSGFVLPPSQIKMVGTETFEAIKVIHDLVKSKYASQN